MSGWTIVLAVGVWCLLVVPLGVLVGRALARRRVASEADAAARRADPSSDESTPRAS